VEDVSGLSNRLELEEQAVQDVNNVTESHYSDSSDSEDEYIEIVPENHSDENSTHTNEVHVPAQAVMIQNEIPDLTIRSDDNDEDDDDLDVTTPIVQPQPIVIQDVPVPVVKPVKRPIPTPRRSQRNRVSPDRYGEWVKTQVANKSSNNTGNPVSNSTESHKHEALGLLIDKFLDKLIN
jgi:hypothetical protein